MDLSLSKGTNGESKDPADAGILNAASGSSHENLSFAIPSAAVAQGICSATVWLAKIYCLELAFRQSGAPRISRVRHQLLCLLKGTQ